MAAEEEVDFIPHAVTDHCYSNWTQRGGMAQRKFGPTLLQIMAIAIVAQRRETQLDPEFRCRDARVPNALDEPPSCFGARGGLSDIHKHTVLQLVT